MEKIELTNGAYYWIEAPGLKGTHVGLYQEVTNRFYIALTDSTYSERIDAEDATVLARVNEPARPIGYYWVRYGTGAPGLILAYFNGQEFFYSDHTDAMDSRKVSVVSRILQPRDPS